MLAARMYGVGDLRIEEVAKPKVGQGELLVKTKVSAVCGTDVRMFYNGSANISEESPIILGHEFAGTIEDIGEGVTGYSIGTPVAVAPNMGCGHCDICVSGNGQLCEEYRALGVNTNGGFAEYVLIPKEAVYGGNVTSLGNSSFIDGALNEPFSCAFNGFERNNVKVGDYVLVVGAGAIGLMHAKLAKLAGATKVVLSDLSDERQNVAKEIDPDFIVVGGLDDNVVRELTDGRLFDVIVTACPVPAVQQAALNQAAINARICFFGGLPKDREVVPLNSNIIHYKQLIVSGTTRASLTQYRKTLGLLRSGVVTVENLVTKSASLKELPQLLELAKNAIGLKNIVTF